MFDDLWDSMTSSEKQTFQRVCRLLLKSTFIVRDKDKESKNAYLFAVRNEKALSNYFEFIGFNIVTDRNNGVVMLKNKVGSSDENGPGLNRLVLKKYESILLFCLCSLYNNKMISGKLSTNLFTDFTEIKLELEKYKIKDKFDRSLFENAFALFKKYNLIGSVGQIGDDDYKVLLYPSLQFVMDQENFNSFIQNTGEKIKKCNKKTIDSEEEEEDEDAE